VEYWAALALQANCSPQLGLLALPQAWLPKWLDSHWRLQLLLLPQPLLLPLT